MMKINKIITISALMLVMISTVGCNDFLDKEPYTPSPTSFFNNAEQLDAYVLPNYGLLPVASGFSLGPGASGDTGTDNQVNATGSDRWVKGKMKVEDGDDDEVNWDWTDLYNINYFLDVVLPKKAAGEISGDASLINHYIGSAELRLFSDYQ